MSGKDTEEKTLPPTQQKLKKQRDKGNVTTSKETIMSLVLITSLAYLYFRREDMAEKLAALYILEPAGDGQGFAQMLEAKTAIVWSLSIELLVPFMALTAAVSILVGFLISGPVFAVEGITPKFEKINPAAGFKRIFSRKMMMSFLMHLVRFSALTTVFGLILVGGWSALIRAPICGLGCAAEAMEAAFLPMVIGATAVMGAMAIFDYLVQRSEFLREQKMSITEFKREMKDLEGDPYIKGQREQDQRDMVETPTGVKQATLLIDNSPDRVIGIRYVDGETPAPIVVVKVRGGASCRRILSKARITGVQDSDLASALAKTPVGGYITDENLITQLAPLMQRALMEAR